MHAINYHVVGKGTRDGTHLKICKIKNISIIKSSFGHAFSFLGDLFRVVLLRKIKHQIFSNLDAILLQAVREITKHLQLN